MEHIVDSCPLTKLDGGLLSLHEADEDAISWLKMTATKALAKWNEFYQELDQTYWHRSSQQSSFTTGHSISNQIVTLNKIALWWQDYGNTTYAAYVVYPHDTMLPRVIVIAKCLSICLSVCPSCAGIVSKRRSVMISSPSGSPKTLVFWRQISSPNSKGFPPNGGLKEGWGKKIQRFSSFKRQYLENGSRYGQSYY